MEGGDCLRLKLDENLSRHLREPIANLGHDVDTVLDEKLGGAPDSDVAEAARSDGRVLLTLDRWLADVRAYPPGTHPGIIVFRPSKLEIPSIGRMVMEFLGANPLEEFGGCIVVVGADRIRIRRAAD